MGNKESSRYKHPSKKHVPPPLPVFDDNQSDETDKKEEESNRIPNIKLNNNAKNEQFRPPHPPPPDDTSPQIVLTDLEIQAAIKEGRKIVRAAYDYASGSNLEDLNFKKGDVMEIKTEDGEWWLAINMNTGEEGYIPSTYVVLENSLSIHSWYHDEVSRSESEQRLQAYGNSRGTYLVRVSQTTQGAFTLSVLDEDANRSKCVRHYKIRLTDLGKCYVSTKKTFDTISDLINSYQQNTDGLCYQLMTACPKPKPHMSDLSRDLRDKWEVPRSDIQLGQLLGKGNFGEVYKGIFKKSKQVAVKTLKPGTMSVEKFLAEAAIMKTMRHPKIVALFAVCTQVEPIYIITELMPRGSLLDVLKSPTGRLWNGAQLIDIGSQVADGMSYLESKHHIHRDLAARNILVGDGDSVKIGDFGLARTVLDDDEMYTAAAGSKFPIKWTAPEACIYGKFSIKSDVWAYGILLVELFTFGAMPYAGMSNGETIEFLQRGRRHAKPDDCPDELYDNLMLPCWREDPNQRPTFEFLYNTMADYEVSMAGQYQ